MCNVLFLILIFLIQKQHNIKGVALHFRLFLLQNIDHPFFNLINRYELIFYPTLHAVTSYWFLHRFAKNLNKESAKTLGAEEYEQSLDKK
jgi:hypothetical protein